MGTLVYGDREFRIPVDDRALAHLKIVVVSKLRRDEAFLFSWTEPGAQGSTASVWVHPSIPLRFEFDGSRRPALNRAWLEEMMLATHGSPGLEIGPEPADRSLGEETVTGVIRTIQEG